MRWCLGLTVVGFSSVAAAAPPEASPSVERLQDVVDSLRSQLAIAHEVQVALVDAHPLLISVEQQPGRDDAFLLHVEQPFLLDLTATEISAALAHELGHVWIFTHHPYLQTEALANRIALRIVSRESLVQVYQKMWQRQGVQGDLVTVLGE